jgi:protein-S-isoprenylcysteine O-methyltransferase Ste14
LSLPFPAWLRWVGAALGAASLPLLAWVQTALEKYWSALLHLRQEHKLITNGPYRWVRHPMYTALFTFFIATGLITANLGFIALDVLAISVLYLRIPKEENMMIEQFGE